MVLALLNESDLFLTNDAVETIVDQTFKQADFNHDGKIDLAEWKEFVKKNPSLLKNMTLPYLIRSQPLITGTLRLLRSTYSQQRAAETPAPSDTRCSFAYRSFAYRKMLIRIQEDSSAPPLSAVTLRLLPLANSSSKLLPTSSRYGSESEVEDESATVSLTNHLGRVNRASMKSAVILQETGPRMSLRLFKIE